jgi:hypothetical protein
MGKVTVQKSVKGGIVAREARTGRFVSVTVGNKKTNAAHASEETAKKISLTRSAALQRLADR